jgi:heme exporter protein C
MKSLLFSLWTLITLGLLGFACYQAAYVAPTEATMFDAQRIFYYHVPAAATAFSLFIVNCIASIIYLRTRSQWSDALAMTGAEVGVVFCGVVLITGPIWARYAWGTFWVWDARLTTTLLLWLLYVSYLILRRSAEAGSTPVLAAALAVFASLDIPIVYMSNRWFRTNHPQPVIFNEGLDPRMKAVLGWCFLAFMALGVLLAWFRYDLERLAQKINAAHIRRAARGTMAGMLAVPGLFAFQLTSHWPPIRYFHAGALAAWIIYLAYILVLFAKFFRLKKEMQELGG